MTTSPPRLFSALLTLLTRPWVRYLWLLVVLACAAWSSVTLVSGRAFDTSVLALLPQASGDYREQKQIANQQLADFADRRMVFLLGHTDPAVSLDAAREFARLLDNSGYFIQVGGAVNSRLTEQWQQNLFPYRYFLLAPESRQRLEKTRRQLLGEESRQPQQANSDHPLVQQALARLYSPMGSAVTPRLAEDPLQLFFDWQLYAAPASPFSARDGWLSRELDATSWRLVSVVLDGNPYSLGFQQSVETLLQDARDRLPVDVEVLTSGLLMHAAHGARQAQREISTIGLGSLAGITLLLLVVFKRVRFLVITLAPILVGWLFALTVCLLLFEKLHLITLAFGAGLVGVAIDYSLHYLCAAKANFSDSDQPVTPAPGNTVLRRIFPAILLGLISSVLAYLAQAVAPFPGLRQMAVFSACGLLGAWLTVVCWLPVLPWLGTARAGNHAPVRLLRGTAAVLNHWPRVAISSPVITGLLVVLCLAALFAMSRLTLNDNIRHLQTSPPSLLEQEQRVQQITRGFSASQFFILSADSRQALLQKETTLLPSLQQLVQDGRLQDYQATAKVVPPAAIQQANRELIAETVYQPGGLAPAMANALGAPDLYPSMATAFAQGASQPLTLEQFSGSGAGDLLSWLWIGERDGRWYSLVTLTGIAGTDVLADLHSLSVPEQGILFVDTVADISGILETHRQQLVRWLLLAYVLVFALLSWRYGRSAWRVIAAPALASLFTLALLSAAGAVVNLFNLLALLLVLGIGLDASIFLRESRASPHAWLAVTLAAITTLLAFGLLALSQTPVLHQFGITVLLGITGVWLLAPCFTETPKAR